MNKYIYLLPVLLLASCEGEISPIITTNSCSIDTPAANTKIPATQPIKIAGWIFDRDSPIKPKEVYIQLTSLDKHVSKIFVAKMDVIRPDVAKALNLPDAVNSGFTLEIPPNTLQQDDYKMLVVANMQNSILICDNNHVVKVNK